MEWQGEEILANFAGCRLVERPNHCSAVQRRNSGRCQVPQRDSRKQGERSVKAGMGLYRQISNIALCMFPGEGNQRSARQPPARRETTLGKSEKISSGSERRACVHVMSPPPRGSSWMQREIDATKGLIYGKRSMALLDFSRLLPESSGVAGQWIGYSCVWSIGPGNISVVRLRRTGLILTVTYSTVRSFIGLGRVPKTKGTRSLRFLHSPFIHLFRSFIFCLYFLQLISFIK